MKWQGIREDTQGVDGEGFASMTNVSHYVEGELRRRPGLSNRIDIRADVMTVLRDVHDNDNWFILYYDDNANKIVGSSTAAGSSGTDLLTGLSYTGLGNWAIINGRAYYAAPGAIPSRIASGDSTGTNMGIAAPSTAPNNVSSTSGNTTIGKHLVRYRYRDSVSGYVSDPSDVIEIEVTAASNGSQRVYAYYSSDNKVDQVIMEMTVVGGDQFYDVGLYTNTNPYIAIDISISDANLEQQPQRALNASTGNAVPPQLSAIVGHRGRAFGIGAADPSLLYWSGAGFPEGWDSTSQARRLFADTGDTPVALASAYGNLYIMGQFSMAKLNYDTDPYINSELDTINTSGLGVWNQRCVVFADGVLYGLGRTGAWAMVGGRPQKISRPIEETINGQINGAYDTLIHGVFDPRERTITWWYVPTGGATTATDAISFDVDRKVWTRRNYRQGIRCSCLGAVRDGTLSAYVSDVNDNTWRLDQDAYDGVTPGASSSTVFLAGAGSTTTIIQSPDALDTNLEGAYLYNKTTGERRLIASSTSSTVTVASAFSAVSTNDEFWIGDFETVIEPKWVTAGGHDKKARPYGIEVSLFADVDADGDEGKIEVFTDFSSTAETYTANSDDYFNSGTAITDGQAFGRFDLDGGSNDDGYLVFPMFSDWKRTYKIKMTFDKPSGTLRLLSYRQLVNQQDVATVHDE